MAEHQNVFETCWIVFFEFVKFILFSFPWVLLLLLLLKINLLTQLKSIIVHLLLSYQSFFFDTVSQAYPVIKDIDLLRSNESIYLLILPQLCLILMYNCFLVFSYMWIIHILFFKLVSKLRHKGLVDVVNLRWHVPSFNDVH